MSRKKRASSSFMDAAAAQRTHSHRSSRGGEFFICFTSRPSASSSSAPVAASVRGAPSSSSSCSKSLLSPNRSRDTAASSLSTSLSRRLRNSGSVKGAQSPMFPAVVAAVAGERRKGCAFEAAEPSSPKVTCIGQVRVKSKKKKKAAAAVAMAARSRSRRVGSRGEASFRRSTEELSGPAPGKECLPNKNQRWGYQLPGSICEALKAFGSEFSCFFPCGGRSFCSNSNPNSSSHRSPELEQCGDEKQSATSSSSCGAVIARWLMAIEDGGKREEAVSVVVEKRRDWAKEVAIKEASSKQDLGSMKDRDYEVVEIVVDDEQQREEEEEEVEAKEVEAEEEARVSICIPPPNALLLMRCRSDPVRMAALASRFWDSPAMQVHVVKRTAAMEDEEEEEKEECDGNEMPEEEYGQADEVEEVRLEEAAAATVEGIAHGDCAFDGKGSEAGNKVDEQQQLQNTFECASACSPQMRRNPSATKEDQEEAAAAAGAKEISGVTESTEDKEFTDQVKFVEREEEKEETVDGRRSSSCCSSAMDKEDRRRSNKCPPRVKESGQRRSSSSRGKDRRRHSISAEREVRRTSFASEREKRRRSSFSVEGKKRWSFCIEAEELRLETKAIEEEKRRKQQESSCSPGQKQLKEAIEELSAVATEEAAVEQAKVSEARAVAIASSGAKEEVCREESESAEQKRQKSNELPDCLLLMMYEPKVSMEVSKETWVCSTDFLRWHPHHRPLLKGSGGGGGTVGELSKTEPQGEAKGNVEQKGMKKMVKEQAEHAAEPPTKEQAGKPTAEENPTLGKVTGNAAAPLAMVATLPPPAPLYGPPFVLTRCKSEPLRSSARLAPDACFWRDRHRPIGTTGIGF